MMQISFIWAFGVLAFMAAAVTGTLVLTIMGIRSGVWSRSILIPICFLGAINMGAVIFLIVVARAQGIVQ